MSRTRHRRPPQTPVKLSTELELLTYTFSRLPPRQLPLLGSYAYLVTWACKQGFISRSSAGQAGSAIVGVLSMVTGLLLSYRFSNAVAKWDDGKHVWAGVRTSIRDGVRLASVPTVGASAPDSPVFEETRSDEAGSDPSVISAPSSTSKRSSKGKGKAIKQDRTDELTALFVAFAFALQHHLHKTRPLPQPPLCDLLPPSYLSSLKRTEARVRFAESHAGPSGSSNHSSASLAEDHRPRIRRRSTGPPSDDERQSAGMDEWDLGAIAMTAEEALEKLASTGLGAESEELRQQLDQLNTPDTFDSNVDAKGESTVNSNAAAANLARQIKLKSNLSLPHPNLPLALLRLMETYIVALAHVDDSWTEAKRERALTVVKTLNAHLGDAERLSNNPPPLPLTLHLSHVLLIYLAALPLSLLPKTSTPVLILITLLAGYCLLGLEALVTEVGGVFGQSENHHPLPLFANQILLESLESSPGLLRMYRARVVARVGEDDFEVAEIDRRCRRPGEEWVPSFDKL